MNTRMMFVGLRWRLFRQGAAGANLIATGCDGETPTALMFLMGKLRDLAR